VVEIAKEGDIRRLDVTTICLYFACVVAPKTRWENGTKGFRSYSIAATTAATSTSCIALGVNETRAIGTCIVDSTFRKRE
jgi:hypothetical protein